MTHVKNFSVLFSLLGLVGCAPTIAMDNPDFGNAVHNNIAAQIVNPNAPTDKGPIEANGARAALAQERYQTDTVKEPKDISSSNISGGSSSGGSSSLGGS